MNISKSLDNSIDKSCCFCVEYSNYLESEFYNRIGKKARLDTRIIDESTNWFAIPTLGCFLEGYLLLIPKMHILSVAKLDADKYREMISFKEQIQQRILDKTGKRCICFEHGVTNNRVAGANSVNHLHLHIIPCDVLLWPQIKHEAKICDEYTFNDFDALYTALRQDMPDSYLLFQDLDSTIYYIPDANSYPSQFFRIQLAKYLNLNTWDWRYEFFEDKLLATIKLLSTV